ncbi:PrsW family glutamic-type intramembrane protease [Paenibacillus humicola]|uniref:PrsW family glutamic-type intramembrane protease n=1 Tax=Paenibacillus humicola TaxID=3110540 RepID=UPI00237AAEB8|nr:PrsW family glutamic-type intramembrane protease [Paenibacillus humicola]
MTEAFWQIRSGIRDSLESTYRWWKAWLERHRYIRLAYAAYAWISLAVLVFGLIWYKDVRTMMVQYLWSFYVLLQFWVLCRSKTLKWRTAAAFVLAGILFSVPFSVLAVSAVHAVFGGNPSDIWSTAGLTPVAEETFKLIPLAAFLLFSRRASALSLADFTLIGAASGTGFQLMEELSRRWINSGVLADRYGYSVTMLGGETIHWDLFTLFPGRFEESFLPTVMSVSHPVHTAMITLGCGISWRLRKRWTAWIYCFPALLLLWAILDHAAYNGQYELPKWIIRLNDWTGSGYKTKPVFLFMLACSLLADYWALNRVRAKVPRLPTETWINPFSEWWSMGLAIVRRNGRFGYLAKLFRSRRELGFVLLYGNAEAAGTEGETRERIRRIFAAAAGAAILLLAAGALAGMAQFATSGTGSACFSCLFDSLQNWWDGLSGLEKGTIILGALALSLLFFEFWPAVGIALTIPGIAGSGHEIASDIRDPKRLLTPANAASLALALLLSRLPLGKAMEWAVKRGRGRLAKWLEKLLRKERDLPGPEKPHGPPEPEKPPKHGDGDPDRPPDKDNDANPAAAGEPVHEVEIVDQRGNPVGEFDEIDLKNGVFYEDKTAKGLDIINPRTGLPAQTPQQFADKQILAKTRNRILNLQTKAAATRATPHGSSEIPSIDDIKSIRKFVFRLDGDTPELRSAVENSLNRLRSEFPDYTFNVLFGGKP